MEYFLESLVKSFDMLCHIVLIHNLTCKNKFKTKSTYVVTNLYVRLV